MKTFVLLLTMWGSGDALPETQVIAKGLTGPECIAALSEQSTKDTGTLSCEVDSDEWRAPEYDTLAVCATDACTSPIILPRCEYEDSMNCFWDARYRGNGMGQSFYDIGGVRYTLTTD